MDHKVTSLRLEYRGGTNKHTLRIVTVPQRQAAQDRHVECVQVFLEHVDNVVLSLNVEARELTKCNPDYSR